MDYLREILCFLWYGVSSIFGTIITIKNPTIPKQKTLLIVSGVGSQPLAFIFLKRYLEKRDFSVYFLDTNLLEHFGIGFSSLDEIAQRISSFVRENQLTNITILGISAGALPSLLYLEKYDGWKYAKKFVGLSAAFRSGWPVHLFQFIPIVKSYQDASSLFSFSHTERIVSIFSIWDEFVSPKNSQLLGVRQIQLPAGGHAYLQTFSQKTFEMIAKEAQ